MNVMSRICLGFSLVMLAHLAAAQQALVTLNIHAQPMEKALQTFAKQSGLQVVFPTELARHLTAPQVEGNFTPQAALDLLLRNSELAYEFVNERTVAIRVRGALARGAKLGASDEEFKLRLTNNERSDSAVGTGESDSTESQRSTARNSSTAEFPDNSDPARIQEIVVTAQKRQQGIKDVPISITALSGKELEDSRITNIRDLSLVVPNLSVVEFGAGRQFIYLRGIASARGATPLTGMYVDEAPVSGVSDGTSGSMIDLRTGDLERIEVLKGPQGTLYGEGSAGGTLRFITKDPELDSFSGKVSPSFFHSADGGWSEEVKGMVNIPLVEDKFGIRIAAAYENNAGWIDQPSIGREDINDNEAMQVRAKALWMPTPELAIKGMVYVHRNEGGASNRVNQGRLSDSNFLQACTVELDANGSGFCANRSEGTGYEDDYEIYNLTATYDFGFAELLSSTSRLAAESVANDTQVSGTLPIPIFEVLIAGYEQKTTITSQEFRLTSSSEDRFKWTLGSFFKKTQLDTGYGSEGFDASIPSIPAMISGAASNIVNTGKSESWTGFGNISYDLTRRLEVGGGLRYSHDKREALTNGVPAVDVGKFNDWNFRAYASYEARDGVNLYASVADGFRAGGSNSPFNVGLGAPPTFDSENVLSYELGIKTLLADGRISFDAALYYSEYQDIQDTIFELGPGDVLFGYTDNGGSGEVKGVEWALLAQVTERLSVSLSGDVTDTEYTKVTNGSQVAVGDPIGAPQSTPEYRLVAGAEYEFNWVSGVPGFIRVDMNRQGRSFATQRGAPFGLPERVVAPPVEFLNFSIGAIRDDWEFAVFARNLNDERGFLYPSIGGSSSQARPRSVGVSVSKTF